MKWMSMSFLFLVLYSCILASPLFFYYYYFIVCVHRQDVFQGLLYCTMNVATLRFKLGYI